MTVHPADSILIVDFGSQVTQLIARRVREAGVYSEIAPFTTAADAFARLRPRGVILSGSPASVLDAEAPRIPEAILASGVPVLRRSLFTDVNALYNYASIEQNFNAVGQLTDRV